MARKRKVRLLGDDLFARQGSLGVSLSGQTSLVLDPTDRGLHPDNRIYVGAKVQPTAGSNFALHIDPTTQNIQFVEDDNGDNLIFQHYPSPAEKWRLQSSVDLQFEATGGAQIHFLTPFSVTADTDGDKIFFYSTSYKISLSPYTFDLTSDKDFRFHSDTVSDLFIIEGDYGDCVSKQDLRAGRDVISGGVFKFYSNSVGDKINFYSTQYKMGIATDTLLYQSDRYHQWGSDANTDSMILDGDSGDLTLEGMLRSPSTLSLQFDRYMQMGSDTNPDSFYFDGDTGDLVIEGNLTAAGIIASVTLHDIISGHSAVCSSGQVIRGTGSNTFAWGAIQAGDLPAHDIVSQHTATCLDAQYLGGNGAGVFGWHSIPAHHLPTGIDAAKIGAGLITNTVFGYLNGVSSNLQTQIDGKAAASHALIASHTASGLTAGHVLRATGATTFAFGALQAGDLPSHTHSTYLPLAGGTMAGDITLDGNDLASANTLGFQNTTGDKIYFYNTSYKVSIDTLTLFLQSDRYIQMGSDTNPNSFIFDGDTGDLVIEGNLTAAGLVVPYELHDMISGHSAVCSAGQFVRGTGANTFAWGAIQASDLPAHDLISAHSTTCSSGQVLRGTGVNTFAFGAIQSGDLPSHTHLWANLSDVIPSLTQINYVAGVTSAVQTQIDGKAPTSHSVNASTYGYGDTTNAGHLRVGTGLSVTTGTISVAYGSSGSTACVGNDARLSDARTPTSHALTGHTASGLTAGHVLRATGAATFGFGAIQAGDLPLHDLVSKHTATCTSGQVLRGTGVNTFAWGSLAAGDLPTAIDAAKIADGTVSNTEFQNLNGVTAAIQTQIDGKAPTSHAVNASTYGYGDATYAGHVRVGTGINVSSGTISVAYGTSGSSACVGNDARLSDARTPVSHNHPASDINSGLLAIAQGGTNNATYVNQEFLWYDSGTGTIKSSGWNSSSFSYPSHNHDSAYISIISSPTAGNFPSITAGGELIDLGYGPSFFATAGHTHSYLPLAGGTMAGSIAMGSNNITGIHNLTVDNVTSLNLTYASAIGTSSIFSSGTITLSSPTVSCDTKLTVAQTISAGWNFICNGVSGVTVTAANPTSITVTGGIITAIS